MEEHLMEPVELERIRQDATCIIIRIGLGSYELRGPSENILVPESHVAWATVVHDLEGEGYRMVPPEEYIDETGTGADEVDDKIHKKGSLFAVVYGDSVAVPLPQKEVVFPDLAVPNTSWGAFGVAVFLVRRAVAERPAVRSHPCTAGLTLRSAAAPGAGWSEPSGYNQDAAAHAAGCP